MALLRGSTEMAYWDLRLNLPCLTPGLCFSFSDFLFFLFDHASEVHERTELESASMWSYYLTTGLDKRLVFSMFNGYISGVVHEI